MAQTWVPTVQLRWLWLGFGKEKILQQLHYGYEIDKEGFCGAKIYEEWRSVEIVEKK